jgi:nitroreductase
LSEILKPPKYVKSIGIITLGYPKEPEPVEKFERILIEDLIHRDGIDYMSSRILRQ